MEAKTVSPAEVIAKLDEALALLDKVGSPYASECRDLWSRHAWLEELIRKAAQNAQYG